MAHQHTEESLTHAYVAVGIGLVIASFAAVLIRLAQNAGMPSPLVAGGRLLLSFIILTPIVTRRYWTQIQQLKWHEAARACGAGFAIGVHFLLMVYSLENTSVLISQVIVNTSPLWVALLETFLLKADLPRGVYFGLMFTILGGGIIGAASMMASIPVNYLSIVELAPFAVTQAAKSPLLGAIFALFSAIGSASYLTLGRSVRARIALVPYVWIVYGVGAVVSMSVVALTHTPVLGHPTMAYFWLLLLTLGPQLIAHSSFNYAVAYLPATIVSVTTQVVTVAAAVIAFLLFAEIPGLFDALGSVIIGFGVLIAILSQRKKQK